MTNLATLSTTPSFNYDWFSIEDPHARGIAQRAVDGYSKEFLALREQASKLVETNTLALSKCVYCLKVTLQRGEFDGVCEKALRLSRTKAYALAAVGRALQDGKVPEEALGLLNQMAPEAAAMLLKKPEEVIRTHVRTNQETGTIPSRRTLGGCRSSRMDAHTVSDLPKPTLSPAIYPTESKDDVGPRLLSQKIHAKHLIEWITDSLKEKNEVKDTAALVALADQIHRLIPSTLVPTDDLLDQVEVSLQTRYGFGDQVIALLERNGLLEITDDGEDEEDLYIVSNIPTTNEPILPEANCLAHG